MSWTFQAPLWEWGGESAWHFVTLPDEVAEQVRDETDRVPRRGFGSIRVSVTSGGSTWQTSLFPHKESGSFLLPMKRPVRQAEGLEVGEPVDLTITLAG